MSKEEFLERLGQALSGEVSQSIIQENLRYYDSYISNEMKNGTADYLITAEIGDPRLIAKTIIEASIGAEESGSTGYEGSGSAGDRQRARGGRSMYSFDFSKWYWKVIPIVVIFLVVSLVITIVGGIFSLLAPFIVPIFMVAFIYWLIKGGRR